MEMTSFNWKSLSFPFKWYCLKRNYQALEWKFTMYTSGNYFIAELVSKLVIDVQYWYRIRANNRSKIHHIRFQVSKIESKVILLHEARPNIEISSWWFRVTIHIKENYLVSFICKSLTWIVQIFVLMLYFEFRAQFLIFKPFNSNWLINIMNKKYI